ncbi:MAG: hypothetical protein HS111_09860 [Kofleriaceae bacterium]|nr:hypothetical protein [Kofleriaceae bacterium]
MESEPRTARLPICILATARDKQDDVVCMRLSCAGRIESLFAIEGGTASASVHRADSVETFDAVPVKAETVAEMVGEAAEGALLVAWDLKRAVEALRQHHPAPEEFLTRSPFDLELRAATALIGLLDDEADPAIERLAERLSLTPPGTLARERAIFLVRVVRHFAEGGLWLALALGLGSDERKILGTCARRLSAGKKSYGEWTLDDGRDYATEAFEEVIDGLHYAAAGLLKIRQARRDAEVR